MEDLGMARPGGDIWSLVAQGGEASQEQRRGSETRARPEVSAAPASWGSRVPRERVPFLGLSWSFSSPRQKPECGRELALLLGAAGLGL